MTATEGSETPSERRERFSGRPLWLDALLTFLLAAGILATGIVAGALFGGGRQNTQAGVFLVFFLIVVPVLTAVAYARPDRRWYHWLGYELCVATVFALPIPLVRLSWLIVTRRALG